MKRPTLTPQEKLWQHVWQVWPDAMQYEQIETPFDAPSRNATRHGVTRSQAWLRAKQRQQQGRLQA
jgi:predicted transcriptional regulator YdeE